MLPTITKEIAALVKPGRSCDVEFEGDGADSRFKAGDRTFPDRNRIVVDYAGENADTFEASPRLGSSAGGDPPSYVQKTEGVLVTIDGKSTRGGAAPRDHDRVCLGLVDAFVHALWIVCSARNVIPRDVRGGLVDLGADGPQSGARYVLTFGISRSVLGTASDEIADGGATPAISLGVRVGDAGVELSCSPPEAP